MQANPIRLAHEAIQTKPSATALSCDGSANKSCAYPDPTAYSAQATLATQKSQPTRWLPFLSMMIAPTTARATPKSIVATELSPTSASPPRASEAITRPKRSKAVAVVAVIQASTRGPTALVISPAPNPEAIERHGRAASSRRQRPAPLGIESPDRPDRGVGW